MLKAVKKLSTVSKNTATESRLYLGTINGIHAQDLNMRALTPIPLCSIELQYFGDTYYLIRHSHYS
jgi:hypothetical protein